MVRVLTEHLAGLFAWICSVSIMAAILVAFIRLLQRVLKNQLKPRWLYLMWLLVIVRLILPWGPESEFSIYNWIGFSDAVHSGSPFNQDAIVNAGQIAASPMGYREVLVVLWIVGVCLLSLHTVWVNWTFGTRMKRETTAVTDARVLDIFRQCKSMMKVRASISLVESSRLAMPALFGIWKPTLIIPHALAGSLNDDQLRHVFLHELAHSKRNDIKVNSLMYVLLILHWFNPVLWYAYRRMRDDQEIASDALALSCLSPDKRQEYGYTLIKLLENFSQPVRAIGNVNLIGSKAQLQRRMRMIKQFKPKSYGWSFLGIAIIVFMSGCTLTNPKMDANSSSVTSSTASSDKSGSTENTTPPSGSGDQQQNGSTGSTGTTGSTDTTGSTGSTGSIGSTDEANSSASAGTQSTNLDAKPDSANGRTAASQNQPNPVASANGQASESATTAPSAVRAVPAQEARSATQAESPRVVSSERKPASVPAQETGRSVPPKAEASRDQARPVPLKEESVPAQR